MREHAVELNVIHFDPAPFVRAYDKVASHGIEIFTLPELQKRFPDWLERMYTLSNQIEFEIPAADELTPQPLEDFATDLRHPQFLKGAHFFALDGDEWVGMSTLWKTPRKRKLNVGITGVLNSHRRKGIATALKLKTIEFAKEYGATTIATENEENNPMYQLNVMLGFEAKSAWLELRKDLTQAPAIVRPMVRSEQGLAWRPAVQSNLILTPQ